MTDTTHNQSIIDQFTRQAVPFARKPEHANVEIFRLVKEAVRLNAADTVLDVACGPGLLACELAPEVRHVTGIDLTPAMIELAAARQAERGLENLAWQVGDVRQLPFPDGAFSLVVTRFSFHHFPDPAAVLREMVRVCALEGRLAVIDVEVPAAQRDAYDHAERLRDPSHVRALTPEEYEALREGAGLRALAYASYRLEMDLEQQLAASFPHPGDDERLRRIFREDVGVDALGMGVYRAGEAIRFSYPVAIHVWGRAAE